MKRESRRASFLGEHPCMMCPSETADVFMGDFEILYICTECGNPDRRPKKKGRSRRRCGEKRKPQPKPKLTAEEKQRVVWDRAQARHEARVRKEGKAKNNPPVHHWTF